MYTFAPCQGVPVQTASNPGPHFSAVKILTVKGKIKERLKKI